MARLRAMIASPLEEAHVETIRERLPPNIDLIYAPELYPPTRYTADHHGPADFRRTPEQEARWRDLAAGTDIAFDFPYSDQHPHSYAPHLKWIQTTSAGVGQAVTRMGIKPGEMIITTASGIHARPLTEFVFMVLLMVVKEYLRLAADQQAHRWQRFCSDELTGKVLAIVGPGRIGREIARVARTFDMIPVAMARDARPERVQELGVERLFGREDLHQMLGMADVLVICAPHTPQTENLIGPDEFAALKPGVIFINIARGQLVDEKALLGRLQDGTIRFAALDVFRTEPLPPDSPFWDLPNVLINPHSASTSERENGRIVEIFTHNLRCFAEGRIEKMRNVLDIDRMY